MTISLRLDPQLFRTLTLAARAQGISKSELIRRYLRDSLRQEQSRPSAWELGKDLFGRYKSGRGDLSVRAIVIARERIKGKRVPKNRR